MPAIQPARLKMQIDRLVEDFHQPVSFARIANEIISQYADRTHRPSQSEVGRALQPAYNTPSPVLQQILVAVRPLAVADPATARAICTALWAFPVAEPRLLAARVLGSLPIDPPADQEILDLVVRWAKALDDDSLRQRIVQAGLSRLGKEQPQMIIELVRTLLPHTTSLVDAKIGVEMLLALIELPEFQNIPVAFNLAAPLIRSPRPKMKSHLLDLMKSLARRSPQESAFVFEQAVAASGEAGTLWLVRQVLEDFPPDLAERLKRLTHSLRS